MAVNVVTAATGYFGHDRLEAAVLDLDRLAAVSAHDVVVMLLRLAGHVRMLPVGEIQALECAELGEKVQVPE